MATNILSYFFKSSQAKEKMLRDNIVLYCLQTSLTKGRIVGLHLSSLSNLEEI